MEDRLRPPPPVSEMLGLSDQEKLDLAIALLKRSDRYQQGLARLSKQYPHAAERLLSSGAYHLYHALPASTVGVLAHIELNLRDPQHELSEALVSDPAYHLYNWLQLEALLPWSRQAFHDELVDLNSCLEDGDVGSARDLLQKILEQLEGTSAPPMPDWP